MTIEERYDLVVIGGGPGGSTLASFVAMQGHRVLLLEKQRFPRHQIGESLLPATVHGICGLLGLKDVLENAGFPRKRGGTFLWGRSPTPWTFAFSKVTDSATGFAYQVERSKFDKILLDNAVRLGVEVRQECVVKDITLEGARATGVCYEDAAGHVHQAGAAFVADAGGHQSPFHRLIGERVFSRFFQNVALYGYFQNGKRLPPPNSGNILSASFRDGWFWYIPLSDTLTSVGVVVSKEASESIQQGREEAFFQFVDRCPMIREYLSGATRVTEGQYGEFRIRKDYSYCNTSFYQNGLVLIGDAACFVDPVFSSGVHLATYSALLAARSINTCLAGTLTESSCFDEFERRYRREFGNFYQFLTAFYDMHRDEDSYFWEARKVLNTEEAANHAFVRLVAGLSQQDEPLFCGDRFFEARRGLGNWFETLITREGERMEPTEASAQFDRGEFDPDAFMRGFNTEVAQVVHQATRGQGRRAESPLIQGGLIPSPDGFHWKRASFHRVNPDHAAGSVSYGQSMP